MDEVDGEALLAEPEERAGGEEALGGRGEVDGCDDQVDADGGVPLADVDLGREEISGEFEELGGPRGPGRVLSGVGGEVEAQGNEEGENEEAARPGVGVDESGEGRGVGEIGEEKAINRLDLKGFWNG